MPRCKHHVHLATNTAVWSCFCWRILDRSVIHCMSVSRVFQFFQVGICRTWSWPNRAPWKTNGKWHILLVQIYLWSSLGSRICSHAPFWPQIVISSLYPPTITVEMHTCASDLPWHDIQCFHFALIDHGHPLALLEVRWPANLSMRGSELSAPDDRP